MREFDEFFGGQSELWNGKTIVMKIPRIGFVLRHRGKITKEDEGEVAKGEIFDALTLVTKPNCRWNY